MILKHTTHNEFSFTTHQVVNVQVKMSSLDYLWLRINILWPSPNDSNDPNGFATSAKGVCLEWDPPGYEQNYDQEFDTDTGISIEM